MRAGFGGKTFNTVKVNNQQPRELCQRKRIERFVTRETGKIAQAQRT